MNKLIRYYNQNRRELFIIIIIIIIPVFVLHTINYFIVKKNNNISANTETNENNNTVYSIISNTNVPIANGTNYKNVIVNFLDYCNEGNIQKAYLLLSQECKNAMFPTIDYFVENYYKSNFDTSKTYSIENWANSTFKVILKNNILSTGKISSNNIQDFITVIKDNDDYKLNINNYIGQTNLNKEKETDNILMKIVSKNTFMDYEEYTIEIKNNNKTNILLDNLQQTDSIYITDTNSIKYVAYSHELTTSQLFIKSKTSAKLKIKFTNSYITSRTIESLIFSNVIIYGENNNVINRLIKVGLN